MFPNDLDGNPWILVLGCNFNGIASASPVRGIHPLSLCSYFSLLPPRFTLWVKRKDKRVNSGETSALFDRIQRNSRTTLIFLSHRLPPKRCRKGQRCTLVLMPELMEAKVDQSDGLDMAKSQLDIFHGKRWVSIHVLDAIAMLKNREGSQASYLSCRRSPSYAGHDHEAYRPSYRKL